MSDTIFAKIINKEIPAEIIHEDSHCVAFRDANPQAPVHFLVVPRKPIARHQDLAQGDESLMGHLHSVIVQLAAREGISEAYRVVVNSGAAAGQSVFHLHMHVLGGRTMGWPPG